MSKKDNFSQAMFEMFGFGKSPEEGGEELDDAQQFEDFRSDGAGIETPAEDGPAADDPVFNMEPSPFDEPAAPAPFAAGPVVEEPVFEQPAPAPVPAPAPAPAPAPVPVEPAPAARHEYVRRENCTYFAAGTSMEGTLRSDSDVEIVGDFKGEIASDGKVTIHSNTQSSIAAAELILIDCTLVGDAMVGGDVSINDRSSVTGNIRAANIVCSGVIKGNLNVSGNISLTENAQVIGDIKTGTLAMSRGAKVSGKIDMGN